MKNVIVTLSKEKDLFDVGDKNIIYIFKDVDEYEEEIYEIMEKNKMDFAQLKSLVESWGGSLDVVLLRNLISLYKKNKD